MTLKYLPRQSYTERFILRFATVAAVAALGACASMDGIHTDGRLTEVSALHAERKLADVTITPAAWPETDWWTALGDPHLLDALIAEALKDNPDLG